MVEAAYLPLSEFADQKRKITYGIVQPGKLHDEGVPIVRVNNFRGNSLDLADRLAVAPEIESKYRRSRPRPGDLLISLVGSIGQVAIAPDEIEGWNLARAVGLVPFDDILKARWAFYALQTVTAQQFIQAHANTTVQATFNLKDLARIPVPVFGEKADEEALAALMLLDEKIELNRRMNETLETMARAVFRDWFIDFGPTHRKAAGETGPAAILGGLSPDPTKATELAALFPDSFRENGLPTGWEERPLDKIADFLNGLALQKYPAKPNEHSLPVIKIAELRNGVTAKSNRASREVPEKYVLKDGDYIFSWSGSLMAKYWTEGEGALNQHLFKVTSETHPMWVVSGWVEHHLAEFQRIAAAKAVTMGHIKRSHLTEAMCVLPQKQDFELMGEVIGPLLATMIQNSLENQTLAATRDLLLPKLMSGEIRLKDVEELV